MHKATSSHMAKRPKKLLMSKNSKIKGNSFVGVVSKNFEKVPRAIPINNIDTVFMICLLRGIGFSALLISFKVFFIFYYHNPQFIVALLYTRLFQNESDFLYYLFIKAELEQMKSSNRVITVKDGRIQNIF